MGGKLLAPELASVDLEKFMRAALCEAEAAGRAGEMAIGAVLVIDGEIISRGRACHQSTKSQIGHAELNALLNGGERLWTDYRRAILFTTLEPCPMCLGAAVMADVPHIVFAVHDENVHSQLSVETNPYIRRHIKSYFGGVLERESVQLLTHYRPQDINWLTAGGG